MSRNIKEIGKELLGKSLNSFHRKTGLTQLEKNNEMQDGILDGILSQVDDAYIEKTEQSNVIHLDGSGDGVVVVDSIEGNTVVNAFKGFDIYITSHFEIISKTKLKMVGSGYYPTIYYKDYILKPNTKYTLIVNVDKLDIEEKHGQWVILRVGDNTNGTNVTIPNPITVGKYVTTFTTPNVSSINNLETYMRPEMTSDNIIELSNMMILEGDWTNKEIPPYFEGLQSSFEEKVNDEGKYEIEILSQNRNLCNSNYFFKEINLDDGSEHNVDTIVTSDYIRVNPNKTYNTKLFDENNKSYSPLTSRCYDINKKYLGSFAPNNLPSNCAFFRIRYLNKEGIDKTKKYRFMLTESSINNASYIEPKQNKIKLLINEPLRGTGDIKDRLCIKNGKLTVERNYESLILDNTQEYGALSNMALDNTMVFRRNKNINAKNYANHIGDKVPSSTNSLSNVDTEGTYIFDNTLRIRINRNKLSTQDLEGFKTWIASNPIKIVFELAEPVYEEVLNEYGEPILLEGYENGTIYIDSTIVPTTTVRYTPKMESFKTLKEVENNNIMLTNDVNDNIIPYMMDVDLMIMEKEMALMSHKNIRTIGVKDMTSMQKRTQDMLERLIKGKTLTEQECKTRVAVYLNAGKITDEQAKELNFLIDEIYA